ncbi:MAG: hypothetical protein WBR26_07295 [Candidatus Acidiferrum sp.]
MSANGTNGANGNHNHNHADWTTNPRWSGISRPYSLSDVLRLRGSIQIEYTLARLGAERLWNLMHSDPYVPALGAITGNQAIEMVQGGLKAVYGSGWQVAADGNTAGDVYPDQSLYPCDSTPNLVKRIIALSCAPIRSSPPQGKAQALTGLHRSSLMQKPALAVRSTRTN